MHQCHVFISLPSYPRSRRTIELWHWGWVTRVWCAFLPDGPGGCFDMSTQISSVVLTSKITLGFPYPPPHQKMQMKTRSKWCVLPENTACSKPSMHGLLGYGFSHAKCHRFPMDQWEEAKQRGKRPENDLSAFVTQTISPYSPWSICLALIQ